MTTYNTGNPIGSKDPKDLYDNAENLDVLVNATSKDTHPDRFGVPRLTWKGIMASGTGNPAIAVNAAQGALESEHAARNSASSASNSANRAESARDKAEDYRDDAREARDAVMSSSAVTSANIYRTTALGIAGTNSGDMFWVFPNNDNDLENLVLYQNSDDTAVELYEHFNLNSFMIEEGANWEIE